MPLAAAGVGFGMTLLLLGTLWALMCYTALLLLEVYQHVPADTGLGSLAARYLGRYGQWITGFSMMFLMYALTAAYISGAGELIASSVNDWFGSDITPATGAIFFALIGVVMWGTVSGSMLPIVLKKLGADPAASSAPFVATLVDVTGLVIYFTVAFVIMQGTLL